MDFPKLIMFGAALGVAYSAVHKLLQDPDEAKRALEILLPLAGGIGISIIVYLLLRFIFGLQQESRIYAKNISRRDTESSLRVKLWPIDFRVSTVARSPKTSTKPYSKAPSEGTADPDESESTLEGAEPQPIDTSTPDTLFKVSRQRLLDEAVRIDAISRRNLGIGILFSSVALAVLAWPLVSAVFFPSLEPLPAENSSWGILRMYLPRFSVGLLLQFVGFFFLRLYVANELDLKHNKNEITNLEMKMMALQLAKEFQDAPSRKEIMKSLAQTERNFVLKKNERSVSSEALSEYNDLRGLIERLVSKIPGVKEK